MKAWWVLIIVLLLLPTLISCAPSSQISSTEAILIVKEYLEPELNPPEPGTLLSYLRNRSIWEGEWGAKYMGEGHWAVTSCSKGSSTLYTWDYYEKSGIIQQRGTFPWKKVK